MAGVPFTQLLTLYPLKSNKLIPVLRLRKPGGYIEFQAAYPRWLSDDGTAEKAENAQSWLKTLIDGSAKFGKPLEGAIGWKDKMEKAGFVDVKQEIFKVCYTLTYMSRRD